MGGCTSKRWEGLLDSYRSDRNRMKENLSQYKELLKEDTTGQRLKDKSNLCSGFFQPVNHTC